MQSPELEHVMATLIESRQWGRIVDLAIGIFSDEAPLHVIPPSSHVDVLKVDIRARVGFVATNYARWENATGRVDVFQRDVSYID